MDMMWYRRRGLMVTPHIESVTGAIASFNSDYNKIPIKSLICDIEPIQEGEGDPSPENVRPISGRTGLTVMRSGKNLLNPIDMKQWYITGSNKVNVSSDNRMIIVPIKKNTAYVFTHVRKGVISGNDDWNVLLFPEYPVTNQTQGVSTGGNQFADGSRSFNSGNNAYAALKICNITKTDYDATLAACQFELGSTATEYEPYKGSTHSVNWETEAGTVYGGSLDVVSGKLTVDRGYSKLSDLTSWGTYSNFNNGVMRAVIPNVVIPGGDVVTTAIMDCRKAAAYGPIQPTWTTSFAISRDGKIAVPMNRAITLAEFLSEYGNHEVCYPLATPTEIQLTPQDVRTLLGVNNIWCDSGNVSVNYWKWGK